MLSTHSGHAKECRPIHGRLRRRLMIGSQRVQSWKCASHWIKRWARRRQVTVLVSHRINRLRPFTSRNYVIDLLAAWGIDIRWLVTDQLGTPRMVFDQSGSPGGVSRHD